MQQYHNRSSRHITHHSRAITWPLVLTGVSEIFFNRKIPSSYGICFYHVSGILVCILIMKWPSRNNIIQLSCRLHGSFVKELVWVWKQCQGVEIDIETSPSGELSSNITTHFVQERLSIKLITLDTWFSIFAFSIKKTANNKRARYYCNSHWHI